MIGDVLVVGAGPAGAAVAASLASHGHRVTVIDRAVSALGKPCGELVTPRAIAALGACGVPAEQLGGFHGVTHVRFTTKSGSSSTRWPAHDDYADHAVVVPREQLDRLMVGRAETTGAEVLRGHDATAPIVDRGFVRGAHVTRSDGSAVELRAAYTVIADGANSRFGRALGTHRQPSWPSALAQRAIFASSLHDAAEAEFVLDLTDRAGTPITGYGWMFPRGDGTVNVGVLMMSTSPSFQVVKPSHLLEQFVADHAKRWHLTGQPLHPPAGGRIPLGVSVGPVAGPTSLVVGDAVAAANPLSGAGIEYAIETGLLAAGVLDEALRSGNAAALQRYSQLLDDRYGSYFRVGRLVDRVLGRPSVARQAARAASARPALANAFLRVAGNQLRPHHPGATEFGYRLAKAISAITPDP